MRDIKIKIAQESDQLAWDHYVLSHPHGIAYQLWAWKQAVDSAYGFKGIYLIAKKNKNIVGILPIIHLKPPFLPGTLVSLPYCDAGGPLADLPEVETALCVYAMQIARNSAIKSITIRSTRPIAGIDPNLTINLNKVRMLLPLSTKPEMLLSSFKAKLRSQIKKPIKDGLTAHIGGMELINEFYSVFTENMRDLGSPVHSRKWIESIVTAYKNKAVVFIVRMPDRTPAAAGLLLCHPNLVSVPWASSLKKFNRLNPNMLLYWSFLKYSADNSYPAFDYGRSTPGEGTYRFKKQWGANTDSLHWFDFSSLNSSELEIHPVNKNNNPTKQYMRALAENVIRRTPLPVSVAFGTITRKFISL